MATIDIIQDKWYRKAIRAFREYWVPMVKKAESFEAFVKGIAAVTGLPESTVRASLPARNWADFQKEAEKYLPVAIAKIEAAYKTNKWKDHYIRAFSTTTPA